MNAPCFEVTALCHIHGRFIARRKTVRRESSSGRFYNIKNLVCPKCGTWGNVINIKEEAL